MTTLVLESDPAATDVQVSEHTLTVTLRDERRISVPLSWYPRLLAGTEAERARLGAARGRLRHHLAGAG